MRLWLAGLLVLLLVGCAPEEPSGSAHGALASRAAPVLLYWAAVEGRAELRAGREQLGSLETAPGYVPFSGLSNDGLTFATVAVPTGSRGNPHAAELLDGPLRGPWALRSSQALRLQRPLVLDGSVYWIRLDEPRPDGRLALSLMRDDDVLRAAAVDWWQLVQVDGSVVLYELVGGQARLHFLEGPAGAVHTVELGGGEGRNFVPEGGDLWMHWRPSEGGARVRAVGLRGDDGVDRPAAGYGERSFVRLDGRLLWDKAGRHPELVTAAGVLWRGPGPLWTLDGAPLAERGEGVSWVGELR